MFENDYPILAAAGCLGDAIDWLDRADTIVAQGCTDIHTGESFPVPPQLEEAWAKWMQARTLISQALATMKPLIDEERKRCDEND